MKYSAQLVQPPGASSLTSHPLEDFEMAFESLLAQFQVTARQIDRFAGQIDSARELRFLDELISGLLFFETQWEEFDPENSHLALESLQENGDRLIEEAIWLCERSAEAERIFGDRRLALRLRALSKSCHDTHQTLPKAIADSKPITRPRSLAPSLESVAA